jgi:hypothetical protein
MRDVFSKRFRQLATYSSQMSANACGVQEEGGDFTIKTQENYAKI